jgi:DNA-3-methyladenine glycosylase
MKKLPLSFYQREDVVLIAKELLGKVIITKFDGITTTGRITETEAYNGVGDKASHAYGGRRTARTEVMYGKGSTAYVYLCYGIHHLFNVVTNGADVPHAVLIRGMEPLTGIDEMLKRLHKTKPDKNIGKGPGTVSKALGISTHLTGYSLMSKDLYIADDGYTVDSSEIVAGPRIGVEYALEDALLPYRFYLKGKVLK